MLAPFVMGCAYRTLKNSKINPSTETVRVLLLSNYVNTTLSDNISNLGVCLLSALVEVTTFDRAFDSNDFNGI
ncbi:hypothetical protein DASC09_005920 [Saccharomycopsis crataegensis]|uniref:Uncharacterized protein n=1 Tax=Saccharomycopsis crataegensis TaxID=43959 RepID=A0AAV5QEV1_9ASCO|nr:hypothetical protein DASC09_005920 [Saccharomycopsis crataegensis]